MNELFRRALMLPEQASTFARKIDTLHYTVIGTAFVVCFLAFLVIAIFLYKYREREGYVPPRHKLPPIFEHTLAAFTLLTFLVWWGIGFSQYREMKSPPPNAIRVHVVGKQWMWQFAYPNGSAAEDDLRVPVGQPVELLMTSRDVIHSFYVPAFRIKTDVVPGRVTMQWFEANQPGTYDIECAEYCGTGHSRMLGHVIVMAPTAYARWVTGHVAPADLAKTGEQLSEKYGCLRCHTTDGTQHLGPTWKGLWGSKVPLADGTTVIADDAYLTESMMDPTVKMVQGYPPIMPSFMGQMSGPEAAAIVEFIHSLEDPR